MRLFIQLASNKHDGLLDYRTLVLVLINQLGLNLILVLVLTNSLGHHLISVFSFTNLFSHRLSPCSFLSLTILLILLCLAVSLFNSPWLFLFSILSTDLTTLWAISNTSGSIKQVQLHSVCFPHHFVATHHPQPITPR